MNRPICIFCCLFSLVAYGEAAAYKLVVGSMFKNEAPYLKEWIEYYYRLIGVEHFYLYDNESNDNFREVLAPYVAQGIVDLISWPSIPEHWKQIANGEYYWAGYQYGAFDDCIQRALGNSEWVGLFDIDEFLLPLQGPQQGVELLHRLLDEASPEIGTFSFLMTNFGTSHIEKIPEGMYVTDLLLYRQEKYWNLDFRSTTKCIHRPKAVDHCRAHYAFLKDGFRPEGIPPEKIRINHYRVRGISECLNKRRHHPATEEWCNELFDNSIVPFTQILKGL